MKPKKFAATVMMIKSCIIETDTAFDTQYNMMMTKEWEVVV